MPYPSHLLQLQQLKAHYQSRKDQVKISIVIYLFDKNYYVLQIVSLKFQKYSKGYEKFKTHGSSFC